MKQVSSTSSLITNKCCGDYDKHEGACHDEVVETGKNKELILKEFVTRIVTRIARQLKNDDV